MTLHLVPRTHTTSPFRMTCLALIWLGLHLVPTAWSQDGELLGDASASPTSVPVTAPTSASARSAYATMRVEDLPRDSNGLLTAGVWDVIAAEAKARPVSNEARVLRERPIYQKYYASFAGWAPPPPLPVSDGRLRNLSETPTGPRFPITDKVWPSKPGEASVCLWEDDKLAAMSISVDDNNAMDLSYWKELSKKYGGLNVTWFLITGNIDGVIGKGRVVGAGTWDIWQQMLNEGYRLGSHSVTHNNCPVAADGWPGPEWEVAESAHQIDSHVPGHRTRVYAYAGAGVHAFGVPRKLIESAYRPALTKYYVAARAAGAKAINPANQIDYFAILATAGSISRIIDMDPNPRFAEQNLNNLFAADPASPYHKSYRGWANIFVHFINNGKDFDTVNAGLAKCLDFYSRNRDKLWTGYFEDVAMYGQERDTATLTTDEAGEAKIAFTLVSKMEPTIFDYPLTIKVRLPDSWKATTATQKEASLPVQVVTHEGASYALVKVVPDRGQVTLLPSNAN